MADEVVFTGTADDNNTGDPLRECWAKVNQRFVVLAAGQSPDAQNIVVRVETARDEAEDAQAAAEAAQAAAEASEAQAEAARDAAYVNANAYATIAAGLAATTTGQQFQVVSEDGLTVQRYRHDAGPAATPVATYASKAGIDALGIEFVTSEQEPIFSIVDEDGRRTWLETNASAQPTAYALEKMQAAGVALLSGMADFNEMAVAITDENGRRTWLEADEAGGPTPRAAALLAAAVAGEDFGPARQYKSSYQDPIRKVVSGPDIVCWGDSMTAGAGGGGTTMTSVLQTLLTAAGSSAVVRNAGVGGETSVTITARTGATPFIVEIPSGSIPASGGVTVTLRQINGQTAAPLLQGTGTPGSTFSGLLAGVLGTLSQSGGVYTFTRSAPGPSVSVTRPQPFRTNFSEDRRGDIAIIWIGQNGPTNQRAIDDARAIIQHMNALDKRWLVISKPTSTDADDVAWFNEFGRRFIAARQYLMEFGLSDAGITPTAQDITDMAAGVIPSSLRADSVHWTANGYSILGNLVFQRLTEMDWI